MEKSIGTQRHASLAALLRALRLEAGLTQSHVAECLGEPQSFVSKYEVGERRLDLIELHTVAGCLQLSLVELVHRFENTP